MQNQRKYIQNQFSHLYNLKKSSKDSSISEQSFAALSIHPFVNRLTALLESKYTDETFDVTKLSQMLCLCQMQVHRKIKKYTGLSPGKYILHYRLSKAMVLLSNTEYTIGEIAYQTGFSSQNNFSRAFRRECGLSPSQSRKQVINRLKKVNSGLF